MPFPRSGVTRRWLERAAIAIAALATIATSRPRWNVQVTALPAPPDPAKAARVIVEANHPTEVAVRDPQGVRWLRPEPSSAPGKTEYLVPRGARLESVLINGVCHGGLCSGPCKAPVDAFVRIASITATESWRTEHALAPTTTVLDPGAPLPSFIVRFDATREPTLQIDAGDSAVAPQISGSFGGAFYVRWPAANGLAHPVTVTWTARAAIEGPCPGIEPCAAPAGEHVEIRSITREPDVR